MDKEIILAKGVKLEKSIFDSPPREVSAYGKFLGGMLYFDVPKDCDLIILMGNRGGGYVPFRSLLPHQVYLNDIKKIFEEEKFEVIYAIPVKSSAPFPIVYNGEYGKGRWENK